MKVRNYLESIAGVGIFPVITLLIFFLFFSMLLFWVLRSRNYQYQELSQLPLEDEFIENQTLTTPKEL